MSNPFDILDEEASRWSVSEAGLELEYDGSFIPSDDADAFFESLLHEVNWKRPTVQTPGGPKKVPRMISWHADPGLTYSYSGLTHQWQAWTSAMLDIRELLKERTGIEFNGCLANLYENERDSVSMHADDEDDMEPGAPIASVSLGCVRDFVVKHTTTKTRRVVPLEHGSLIIMGGRTQEVARHGIPKAKHACTRRINLTFRKTLRR